jgi:hypothetical protein
MNTQFSGMIALFISSLFIFPVDLSAENLSQDQRIKELGEKLKSTRDIDAKVEEIEEKLNLIDEHIDSIKSAANDRQNVAFGIN